MQRNFTLTHSKHNNTGNEDSAYVKSHNAPLMRTVATQYLFATPADGAGGEESIDGVGAPSSAPGEGAF